MAEIGLVFQFPDFYGCNLDALWDCLNDLRWLNEKNYVLVLLDYYALLENESEEFRKIVWEILQEVKQRWANVPNYIGEEHYRQKSEFILKLL